MPNMEVALTSRPPVFNHLYLDPSPTGSTTTRRTRSPRSSGERPKSEVRRPKTRGSGACGAPHSGSLLLTPILQEMKVQPEMLMKTKDGKEKKVSGIRCQV